MSVTVQSSLGKTKEDTFSYKELQSLQNSLINNNFLHCRLFPAFSASKKFQKFYRGYLQRQYHHKLHYLENLSAKFSPDKIFPNTKSILAVSYAYVTKETQKILKNSFYKVSRYACGKDYHTVLKKKLQKICKPFQNFRVVVDSTPFPERYYGRVANLGFIGKNGLLIHPQDGSYFFLAFVFFEKSIPTSYFSNTDFHDFIIDYKTDYNIAKDIQQYCKDCNRCVQSCPTGAILQNGKINTKDCISYKTIEAHVVEQPFQFEEKLKKTKKHRWVFGCDICQMVCPYNKDAKLSESAEFQPLSIVQKLVNDTSMQYQTIKDNTELYGSPLLRVKKEGIAKNQKLVDVQNFE